MCENEDVDSLVKRKIYRKEERGGKYAGKMCYSNDVQMEQPQLSVTTLIVNTWYFAILSIQIYIYEGLRNKIITGPFEENIECLKLSASTCPALNPDQTYWTLK